MIMIEDIKIKVINSLSEKHINQLVELYQNEWFTKGRKKDDVIKMLNSTSFAFGFCNEATDELIGFARVITDCVYKAFVFDVIVDSLFRGKGFGEFIMNTIFDHPILKNVSHMELYCPDKIAPFYEKMGFQKRTSYLLRKEMKN
ncbi:MAG: GNAT family N-acetyltransferase [bacterium]|nr:GNAT family N-acetyltransferase [bacterium]